MRIGSTIRPGQPGSKRFVKAYGDDLVCVRYRYDAALCRRVTTVELVVDEGPWEPGPKELVHVRVHLDEPVLRRRIREAGGRWDRRRGLWEIERGAAVALDMEERISPTPAVPRDGKEIGTSGDSYLYSPSEGPPLRSA